MLLLKLLDCLEILPLLLVVSHQVVPDAALHLYYLFLLALSLL
jgi:hypothetical protein